jgi:hypothetical protein
MGRKCSNCGFDGNTPEWEFCGHCGTDLIVVPSSTPVKGDGNQATTLAEIIGEPVKVKTKPTSSFMGIAKLIVMQHGKPGHEFSITGQAASIGRWDADAGAFPEIDLSEDDPGFHVSRHHARIFVKDDRFFIEDLGSTNKTVINKADKLNPHSPHELKNGDEIIVGKTFLKFVIEY